MSRKISDLPYNDNQKLDLHLSDSPGQPLVVCIHGGGFISGDKADERCRQSAAILTAAGFNMASLSYSLATADDRFSKWPRNLFDIADAMVWLSKHAQQYGYDFNRLGMLGFSAGCCLSNLYILGGKQLFDRFSYDTAVFEPAALAGFYGPYDFPSRQQERRSGDDQLNLEHSPSYWFKENGRAAPPVLHIHGNHDTVVYPDQPARFQADYRSRNLTFTAIIAEGFGHSFAPRDTNDSGESIDLGREIADFFSLHLA